MVEQAIDITVKRELNKKRNIPFVENENEKSKTNKNMNLIFYN